MDDIVAVKQVNNIRVVSPAATNLRIKSAVDSLVIKSLRDVAVSGGSTQPDEIIITAQEDNLIVTKPKPTNLRIID